MPLLELDTDRAKRIVNRILSANPEGRELDDEETRELLDAYGIELVPHFTVATLAEATAVAEQLGWNVVLKGTAASVRVGAGADVADCLTYSAR